MGCLHKKHPINFILSGKTLSLAAILLLLTQELGPMRLYCGAHINHRPATTLVKSYSPSGRLSDAFARAALTQLKETNGSNADGLTAWHEQL